MTLALRIARSVRGCVSRIKWLWSSTISLCRHPTYGHLKWRDKGRRCAGHMVLDSQKNLKLSCRMTCLLVENIISLTISPHHFHSNHRYHHIRISSFVHPITRSRSLTTQVRREITRLPAFACTIFIHLKSASGNDSTRYQEVYCS